MSTVWRSRMAAFSVAVALVAGPVVALGAVVAMGDADVPVQADGAFRVPAGSEQLVVGVAESWASTDVALQRFERVDGTWRSVDAAWRGRLGERGLAWGRGLHPLPTGAVTKVEDDLRSPAGVFRLSRAFGYDPAWALRTRLPYTAVTARDLFIDDSSSPLYNTHVRLDHNVRTAWERRERMHTAEPSHRLQVLVDQNTAPVVPGAGSAIFLHIWRRSGLATTAGCTSMSDADIERLVRWLHPARAPLYVLLPRAEYQALQAAWDLPLLAGMAPAATTSSTSTTLPSDTTLADSSDAIVPAP